MHPNNEHGTVQKSKQRKNKVKMIDDFLKTISSSVFFLNTEFLMDAILCTKSSGDEMGFGD